MRAEPKTYVWFFDTFSAVLGPLNEATMHAHPVAQLTVGLDVPLHIHVIGHPAARDRIGPRRQPARSSVVRRCRRQPRISRPWL
ncbi:hypothetical protein [Nocardia abscessus]|uniref:hypothetical protein n=1 Tax=Nocardia abscessus TaxID=120957 RepID=UPI002453905C|nr:hypothetical protein [Nocardia abscessus]